MWHTYVVTGTAARLSGGRVRLDPKQAASRGHNLTPLAAGKRKGEYAVERPIEFKRGEIFEYDGDVPKALANLIDTPNAAAKKAAAEKAAAEQAALEQEARASAATQAAADEQAARLAAAHEAVAALDARIAAGSNLAEDAQALRAEREAAARAVKAIEG